MQSRMETERFAVGMGEMEQKKMTYITLFVRQDLGQRVRSRAEPMRQKGAVSRHMLTPRC